MSGHRRAYVPARDRIACRGRIGGGAFNLLKSGRAGAESAKQVEIRLANLLKILAIARRGVQNGWRGPGDSMRRLHPISAGYG
jgi:hypothetical protein